MPAVCEGHAAGVLQADHTAAILLLLRCSCSPSTVGHWCAGLAGFLQRRLSCPVFPFPLNLLPAQQILRLDSCLARCMAMAVLDETRYELAVNEKQTAAINAKHQAVISLY